MKNYLRNWNYMRTLRFILGVFIIIQGISTSDWMIVAMGSLLCLMPVLNIGCCSTSCCHIADSKKQKNMNNINFEEIK